jgi:hypothetical protein
MMLDNFGVSEENWRDALRPTSDNNHPAAPAGFALSESPRYAGRAVVALAADPDRARWNGKSVSSGHLASVLDSRTLTAHGPTSGDTSKRSASVDLRQISTTIGN